MMDWTDRHCRFFHRLLTRRARLYTEMVTTAAVLHGDRARLLAFDPAEHPVGVQLGGRIPPISPRRPRICADFGYDEVNLNVGCPSERVQNGAFGACLMREPDCRRLRRAMKAAVAVPVTVKCRIGVDDQDPEEALGIFADRDRRRRRRAHRACAQGLAEGPLAEGQPQRPAAGLCAGPRFEAAVSLAPIAINGGLETLEAAIGQLEHVDGVMIGRAAYQNPALLLEVDPLLFGEPARFDTGEQAVAAFIPYVEARLAGGVPLHAMTRHVLGLFNGCPAPAPGAAICRCRRSSPARGSRFCARRWIIWAGATPKQRRRSRAQLLYGFSGAPEQ